MIHKWISLSVLFDHVYAVWTDLTKMSAAAKAMNALKFLAVFSQRRAMRLKRLLTAMSIRPRASSSSRCMSEPPSGRARWTLELLDDAMIALTEHEGLSP